MTTRLERADEKLSAAAYKKALADLWYAEADHRADPAGLARAVSLAAAVAERTSGRTQREAEDLMSVLRSDLERARHVPGREESASGPAPERPGLASVALVMFVASVILFLTGLGGVQATLLSSGASDFWAGVVVLSLACAAVSLALALAALVQRRRGRA